MQPSEESLLGPLTDQEREWIVRLCVRITGDTDAAEDLAQETLIEAWRNAGKLYDSSGRDRWLAAIARNVCRRWARRSARERSRRVSSGIGWDMADPMSLDDELHNRQLRDLVGAALDATPEPTRRVLEARYVDGLSNAEIAGRIGTSEDAVSMRLTRGRRLLRQQLAAALSDGSDDRSQHAWRETRLWCDSCGARQLLVRIEPAPGVIAFRCPGCERDPEIPRAAFRLANQYFEHLVGGRSRPRVILRRTAAWNHAYFRDALLGGEMTCTHCGAPVRLRRAMREAPQERPPEPVLFVACDRCGEACSTSLSGLVSSHPAVQSFWDEHRRIRAVPAGEIESEGVAAIVSRFEAVTRRDSLAIVSARDSLAILAIHPEPAR